jgi:hypothetical protein
MEDAKTAVQGQSGRGVVARPGWWGLGPSARPFLGRYMQYVYLNLRRKADAPTCNVENVTEEIIQQKAVRGADQLKLGVGVP